MKPYATNITSEAAMAKKAQTSRVLFGLTGRVFQTSHTVTPCSNTVRNLMDNPLLKSRPLKAVIRATMGGWS